MNNKERFIWLSIIIFALTYLNRKELHIENLKHLNKSYQLSSKLQSDQINEMLLDYSQISRLEYDKGFKDGKTNALVSVMHKEELNSYSDGYHAALSQMELEGLNKDLMKKVVKNLKSD
jgi:hypothetical protein